MRADREGVREGKERERVELSQLGRVLRADQPLSVGDI